MTLVNCSCEISGPMSVLGSRPGPIFRLRANSATPEVNSSKIAVLDQQSGAGRARLAVVEQEPAGDARYRGFEVGVGEDHLRALAAEFQRDLLQVAGRGGDDLLADLGGTGEGDLVDVGVRGQRGA